MCLWFVVRCFGPWLVRAHTFIAFPFLAFHPASYVCFSHLLGNGRVIGETLRACAAEELNPLFLALLLASFAFASWIAGPVYPRGFVC